MNEDKLDQFPFTISLLIEAGSDLASDLYEVTDHLCLVYKVFAEVTRIAEEVGPDGEVGPDLSAVVGPHLSNPRGISDASDLYYSMRLLAERLENLRKHPYDGDEVLMASSFSAEIPVRMRVLALLAHEAMRRAELYDALIGSDDAEGLCYQHTQNAPKKLARQLRRIISGPAANNNLLDSRH